jgi:hypothetical protein
MPLDDENPSDGFASVEGDSELVCWLSPERICGIDCAAYDMRCAEDSNFYPCSLINIGRVASTALIRLSKVVQDKPEKANPDPKAELNNLKPPPIG